MNSSVDTSNCAVAKTLAMLGDRWTLLVVRELMLNRRLTYKALSENVDGIPTNILSDRLKKLVDHGLVGKELYNKRPPRYDYSLTKKGISLRPVLIALAEWGAEYLGGELPPKYRQATKA